MTLQNSIPVVMALLSFILAVTSPTIPLGTMWLGFAVGYVGISLIGVL